MSKRIRSAAHTLAAALLLAASALPGGSGQAEDAPEPLPRRGDSELSKLAPSMTHHKVVLITLDSLTPGVIELEEGQLVAWISYSVVPSVVVFEREVARSMICHSLVNFAFHDDELRSAPIHAGEFASFCQLQPGRYRYKVVRPEQSEKAPDAPRELEGEIVVGNTG